MIYKRPPSVRGGEEKQKLQSIRKWRGHKYGSFRGKVAVPDDAQ